MYKLVLDEKSAVLSVNAGGGNIEACAWAAILLRMYRHFAEINGYEFTVGSAIRGDGPGIRLVVATVRGLGAYGQLNGEAGVHRLVRISPFDASKRRHTSFAAVSVMPDIDDCCDIPHVPKSNPPIRSYVLHPYTMVKDHRTSVEVVDAQAVLDGKLGEFVTAYLLGLDA